MHDIKIKDKDKILILLYIFSLIFVNKYKWINTKTKRIKPYFIRYGRLGIGSYLMDGY